MRKEEAITGMFACVGSTGKKDFIQEISEKVTVQRQEMPEQLENRSYRRVSDRADVNRLSEREFQVVITGEKIIIK